MTARCQAPTCNRPLKTEESKRRGMGPVCWRREHGAPPAPRGLASHHHIPAAEPHPVDPNQIPLPLETLVDAETRKAAVDVVARHALHREIDHAVSCGRIEWSDYPDLVEADWGRVLDRVAAIAQSIAPSEDGYQAAYEHLSEQPKGEPRP